jgi:Tol biopolymer transport system component
MKTSLTRAFQTVMLGTLLLASTIPAQATFPGKNGRIAFILGPDVYTMNPDGSDVKQLTNLGPDSAAFWQSWSPDGKQIVFVEFNPPDFVEQLWLMNADGSNQHLLLSEDNFNDERPKFTPDGSSIVFSRCTLEFEPCAVYQVGVDGSSLKAITQFDFDIRDVSPAYSPDGTSLVFFSTGRTGIIAALYLDRVDKNLPLLRLTPAKLSARLPDWSPNGKKIAFSTHCCNPQNEEIWAVDLADGGLHRLTKNGDDYFAGPHDLFPSWSPEGDAVVFERVAPDFSSSGIFIMKADGSETNRLMSLGNSPRAHSSRAAIIQRHRNRISTHHLREIEEGGALPQWGVAPK